MKFTKPKFERPITGVGKAKVGTKSFSLVDLTFRDDKGNTNEDTFSFKLSDLPEDLPDGFEIANGKDYFASITSTGDSLLNIRPAKGTFTVACSEFSETKDGDILVLERTGKFGTYHQFVPLLTVTKGAYKGINFPLYLPFGSDGKCRLVCGDTGLMEVVGNPDKSRGVSQLFDFLTFTGVADLNIKYPMDGDEPDNDPQAILNTLLKAVRKAGQEFTILADAGYVKAMAELDDVAVDDDDDAEDVVEDDEEEDVKPKAKAKAKVDVEDEEEDDVPAPKAKRKPKFD